jgi:hypothetical protein
MEPTRKYLERAATKPYTGADEAEGAWGREARVSRLFFFDNSLIFRTYVEELQGGVLSMLSEKMSCFARVAVRLAVAERMPERLEVVADRVAASTWEAPAGGRKYWRLRKEDGSYEYRETPPEERGGAGQEKGEVTQEGVKDKGKAQKKGPAKKVYKHHLVLSKDDLKRTLSKGHFTILSAGLNPKDKKESKMGPDDEFFHKRNLALRDELEKAGFNYTEATGHYEGKEPSLMVFHEPVDIKRGGGRRSFVVHHESADELKARRAKLEELGEKFNQNSVLHGSAGKNTMYFTTGKRKGKECGGKGWNEAPDAKDYYTEMEMENKKRTKFQLDVKECFERGFL